MDTDPTNPCKFSYFTPEETERIRAANVVRHDETYTLEESVGIVKKYILGVLEGAFHRQSILSDDGKTVVVAEECKMMGWGAIQPSFTKVIGDDGTAVYRIHHGVVPLKMKLHARAKSDFIMMCREAAAIAELRFQRTVDVDGEPLCALYRRA